MSQQNALDLFAEEKLYMKGRHLVTIFHNEENMYSVVRIRLDETNLNYDEKETILRMEEARELFNGIAPIRLSHGLQFHLGVWDVLTEFMGIENIYYDFMAEKTAARKVYWGDIIKFVLVKNVFFPAVFLGLLVWLRLEFSMALILILQAAVPPVTAIPIFAERSGGNRSLAGQLVVASFLFSVFSIPAVLFLFTRFFPFPV